MQASHSPSPFQPFVNLQRIARTAVLNGIPIPPTVSAQLEALGVNVGELEQRLRQNMEFRR